MLNKPDNEHPQGQTCITKQHDGITEGLSDWLVSIVVTILPQLIFHIPLFMKTYTCSRIEMNKQKIATYNV